LSASHGTGYDCTRLALGTLLLTAAALKGHQLATAPVLESGLLTSRWFLIAVVQFEFFFALWLLSGLYPTWTWRAALACFSVFAGVTLSKGLAGESSCGCFGRVPVNPWYTLFLDLCAVAALLAFRPLSLRVRAGVMAPAFASSPPGRGRVRARLAAVLALFLALGIPAGWTMSAYQAAALADSGDLIGSGKSVVLEPENWVGKPLPLLRYIDLGNQLTSGRWVVVLYRHDCPHCQRTVPQCAAHARELAARTGTRVALVEMPPYAESPAWLGDGISTCVLGRLSDSRLWFVRTPVILTVEDGVVKARPKRLLALR
jgi:hypothetical protein